MVKRGVWFVFALIIVLMVSFAFSNISVAKDSGMKVSSEVSKAIQENGKARVIVVMKDSPSEFGKFSISASDSRKQAIAEIGKEKIGYEFQSFNGFSAALTQEDIAKLETDDSVERIEHDMPVQISLQQSVPLINASLAWPVQVNGINITGQGETICIIDTGINYSHVDLGGCNINYNRTHNITGSSVDYVLQNNNHPYNVDLTENYTINYTGFSKIAVHFMNISTETDWDFVDILDSNNNTIVSYTGGYRDIWTPSINGDTVNIRLRTDSLQNDYGFYIDKILNGATGNYTESYNWSNCQKVIGGWDYKNKDPDPYDDHWHGTHVAGIAAANGTIKGVAPDAKIASVKVMDASGNGYSSDVIKGIEWCTGNSTAYNVSVISISLGGGSYTSYCDSDLTSYRDVINAAVGKNISVIVATGNTDPLGYIRAPACIRNATAVGGTTKADAMMYNRNNITDLLAPGFDISSTVPSGYGSASGTSMATPHVAGAFALVRQFYKLQSNRVFTPAEIENVLNDTGKRIADTGSGLNFSRIDVYSAMSGLVISTVSPVNGKYYNTKNIFIDITTSSFAQTIWWSNGTANITYSSGYYNFSEGNYTLIAYANDSYGNLYENSPVFVVDITSPTIDIIFPQNVTYTNRTLLTNIFFSDANLASTRFFNGTANETYTLPVLRTFNEGSNTIIAYASDIAGNVNQTNRTFSIDSMPPNISFTSPLNKAYNTTSISISISNSSDAVYVWWYNESANLTYTGGTYANFSDGNHTILAYVNDSVGNINSSSITFSVDTTPPSINIISPTNVSWDNGLFFNVSIGESGFCWAILNDTTAITLTNKSSNSDYFYNSSSYGSQTPGNSSLNVTFYCNDSAGNQRSKTHFFGIDITPPSVSLEDPYNGLSTPNTTAITFRYSPSDDHKIISCSLVIDNNVESTSTSINNGTFNTFSKSISTGEHRWNVTCIDEAGNSKVSSDTRTITKTGTSSNNDGSSTTSDNGDTGGADTEYEGTIYNVTGSSITNGTSKRLRESDKLVFKINGTEHSLTVLDINFTSNITSIKIRSTIITADLKAGEEKKFDVTEDNYLDLYIKLNDVKYPRANLTIKEIYEKSIVNITTNITTQNETESNWSIKETFSKIGSGIKRGWSASWSFIKDKKWWFIGGLIVAVLAGMVVAIKIYMRRKGYRLNLGALFVKEKEGNAGG
jgi:subtilisin family serine protease